MLSSRIGSSVRSVLALLHEELDLAIVPFEAAHARAARDAFELFGRGRHPAASSFGDCLTYATARLAGRPLLFVGDDFAQTDIEAAL